MGDTTVTLIAPATRTQDATGVWRTGTESTREVFAHVESVGRNEFFAAGQQGLRPELRITVFAAEYQGEQLCELDGVRYSVYRTYRVSEADFRRTARNAANADYIELYVQREVGVHGNA